MTSYALREGTMEIDPPVLVGARSGHLWFPTLHPFTARDILCLGGISDDKAQGRWPGMLYLSRDGGASWAPAAEIPCCGPASVALGPKRRLLMPYELWPLTPGERRNLIAEGTVLEMKDGGAVTATPAPVRFLGFPADLADYHQGELTLLTNGNILPLRDGRLFTTLYGIYAGEERYRLLAVTSDDGGFTWRFHALVASWQDIPAGPEGPCESHSARLADGRLLCVYRVGSGRAYPYHQSSSADEGLSWTKPQPLQGAWSVEPQLVLLTGDHLARLAKGSLLLSGGRTGLFLWVSADGSGEQWQAINLAEHHNATRPDAATHFSRAFAEAQQSVTPAQSTSYTGMIQVAPNEALLCYDRLANGWQGASGPWGDRDMLFCLRIRSIRG
jgi:hypothetical protein